MGRRRAGDMPSGLAMAVACAMSGDRRESGKGDRMKPLDVLMPATGMGLVAELIEERFPLHRLWLEPDRDAWLAEHGPSIRAIASAGGHGRIDEALMRRLPKLEIVASFGVGYDHVDARWAGEHGIVVTHTPGVLDDEVADVAMALMIMTVRQLPQAERYLRAGQWLKASVSADRVAARADARHSRPRPDRQGDRPARRGFRARGRLSRPPRAARSPLPLLPVADRDGRGLRHPDGRRARRAGDAAHRQCRGPAARSARTACSSTSRAARWSTSRP